MKAVVFHDIDDIRLDDVRAPTLRGTVGGMAKGDDVPDQVIAEASPYHESRSEQPGHR